MGSFVAHIIQQKRSILGYLLALCLPFFVLYLHLSLPGKIQHLHYLLFYPTVFLISVIFSTIPGVITTVISALLVDYFLVKPYGIFLVSSLTDLLPTFIFISMGGGISFIAGRLKFFTKEAQLSFDQLKASEKQFRAFFELAGHGSAQVDPNTFRFMRVNQRLCEMTGYSEEELLTKTFLDISHPEEVEREKANYLLALQNDEKFSTEKRYVRKDQTELWVLVSATIVRDFFGRPLYSVAVIHDMSELKKAEVELYKAIHARDEFLSIASHELKTPLTSLKLQIQMRQRILRKGDRDYFQFEKLAPMFAGDNRQIDQITRLIDDMLDISRLNTGKLTIEKEEFNLCDLVSEVIERHRFQFESSGGHITFDSEISAEGEWDRFRIEQVVTNLLSNAMKYGGGNPITVEMFLAPNNEVWLSVRDRGIGIKEEHLDLIFQRFERSDSPKAISGLGLGLYIVKQIIEMHQGKIWVESVLGEGSVFHVQLPLSSKYISDGTH
jgi:PAS domain S-box-containing protein